MEYTAQMYILYGMYNQSSTGHQKVAVMTDPQEGDNIEPLHNSM